RSSLSAKENICALISMVARSTARSNQRPDTLMQDHAADRSTKASCNARPHHTLGSSTERSTANAKVRFSAIVLKNSLAPLLTAIFESGWPARQLCIALLDNSTNQSFAVYRPPDFFNNIPLTQSIRARVTEVRNGATPAMVGSGNRGPTGW